MADTASSKRVVARHFAAVKSSKGVVVKRLTIAASSESIVAESLTDVVYNFIVAAGVIAIAV